MAAWTQHSNSISTLTGKQRRVLELIAAGRTNPEIADALGVSLGGAKWHVSELISKLGVETREEAAELWRQERRLPRRFRVASRALFSLGGLKIAAGGVAAAATLGVGLGTWSLFQDGEREPGPEAEVRLPSALFTRAEAEATGRQLAFDEIARNSWLSSLTVSSRPVRSADLALADIDFVEKAAFETAGMPGLKSEFPAGRNVWTTEFVALGFDAPASGELRIKVMFEDGQATLLESWTDSPDGSALPPEAHPPRPSDPPTTLIASFELDGQSWDILAGPDSRFGVRTNGPGSWWTCVGGSAFPGAGIGSRDLFAFAAWKIGTTTVAYGALSPAVARIDATFEDGSVVSAEPTAPSTESGFQHPVFGLATSAADELVSLRAVDAAGVELARVDAIHINRDLQQLTRATC